MDKGFGIAALVIAVVAIFIPVVSLYVVYVALILAIIAAFSGDKIFSVATLAICLVNVMFLSPLTVIALIGSAASRHASGLLIFTIIMFVLPIVGMIMAKKKSV
jgi:hypothetical protein